MPFADRGESSAKFAAFNAAQMAKRAAEVDAEDRLFEAKERERQKAEAKRAAQAKKNLERRARLLRLPAERFSVLPESARERIRSSYTLKVIEATSLFATFSSERVDELLASMTESRFAAEEHIEKQGQVQREAAIERALPPHNIC